MPAPTAEPQIRPIPSSARRPGWVNISGRARACMVSELTETGALLTFGIASEVPMTFMLHLNGADAVHHCRVQSNNGLNVRVVFEADK